MLKMSRTWNQPMATAIGIAADATETWMTMSVVQVRPIRSPALLLN